MIKPGVHAVTAYCVPIQETTMFYEEFELFPKDDDPAGEYLRDQMIVKLYLPHNYDIQSIMDTISHEWLHGLFDWAIGKSDPDADHFIIRLIHFV